MKGINKRLMKAKLKHYKKYKEREQEQCPSLIFSVSLLVIINKFIYLFTDMIIKCLDKLFDFHL
jgi:hypothetical protein